MSMVMRLSGRSPIRLAAAVLAAVSLAGCTAAVPGSAGTGSAVPVPSAAPGAASPAAGGGGGAVGGAVAAGDDLCKLLGPGDFSAAGVSGAGGPTENNQPPTDFYCVYRGKSSATGGIELDAFLADSPGDAHATFADLFGEFNSADDSPVPIAGADEAQLSLPADGSSDPALIGVRKGKLTFGLGIGSVQSGSQQQVGEQLKQLAALVVQRAGSLGS